jgi:hypothetical protein
MNVKAKLLDLRDDFSHSPEVMARLSSIIESLGGEAASHEDALIKIKSRFEGKLNLHKEDCFAYQVAKEALR